MSAPTLVSLTLAVAQPFCVPGDVEGNLDRMEPLVGQAAAQGARLVVFSEGGVTGYEAAERSWGRAVTLGDGTCRRLQAMAAKHGAAIVAGFIEKEGPRHHVTQGVFWPDGKFLAQRKWGMAEVEKGIPNCAAGAEKREVFEVGGVKCAIAVCADFGIENLWEKVGRQGVQLLLMCSAGCGKRSFGFSEKELDDPARRAEWVKRSESVLSFAPVAALCRQHGIAFAACNQMADDGKAYFHPGHCGIVDSNGETLALVPGVCVFEHLRERLAVATVHARPPRGGGQDGRPTGETLRRRDHP
jgi:predicted amidohydrolase